MSPKVQKAEVTESKCVQNGILQTIAVMNL